MGRKVLAVIVALVVAVIVIMTSQMLTSLVVEPPNSAILGDRAAMGEYMSRMPGMVFVIILIGYAIAAFIAGFVVAKMSRQQGSAAALAVTVGIVLTLWHVANVALLPHRLWFILAGLLVFIPLTLVGHRIAR